jgi:hypothetical protein
MASPFPVILSGRASNTNSPREARPAALVWPVRRLETIFGRRPGSRPAVPYLRSRQDFCPLTRTGTGWQTLASGRPFRILNIVDDGTGN